MCACKGVCERYRATGRDRETKSLYRPGVVRCTTCNIFIEWDQRRCPCCAYQVKRKPLAAHVRRLDKFRQKQNEAITTSLL